MSGTTFRGTLLMESHGIAPDVRSSMFAGFRVRSMLYQAGPYFVDLTIAPEETKVTLSGELMTESGEALPKSGIVVLYEATGERISSLSLDVSTHFEFAIRPERSYRLELTFPDATLHIAVIDDH